MRFVPSSMRPRDLGAGFDAWARIIEDALAQLPPMSTFSTLDGPNSEGVYADPGTIGFELASSATTRVWVKQSASTSTTGWTAL